jgi:hypothetical protein
MNRNIMRNNNVESQNNNTVFLQQASAILDEIDMQYTEADLDTKVQLKPQLDAAILKYSQARLKILQHQITCTSEDIAQMQALRQEIGRAASVANSLKVLFRFTQLITRLAIL